MDTSQTTHLSLCSGYGGIDLGLRRVIPDLRTVAYAEIEAFACENLLARMEGGQLDAAPIWSDLKSFPWAEFSGLVDVLSGGYPCQPFSSAGKRAGADDPRHLWPFISAGIAVMRPSLCFFENVEGHISLGLPDVIEDLGRLGYRATWGIFSATECGAPHQRKRVFIMAYREDKRLSGWQAERWKGQNWEKRTEVWNQFGGQSYCDTELADSKLPSAPRFQQLCGKPCLPSEATGNKTRSCGFNEWPSRPGQPQHAWEPPRVVGNATSQRLEGGQQSATARTAANTVTATNGTRNVESALGGDTNGPSSGLDYAELSVSYDNRTDELRLLGNGVVPATAAVAFQTLLNGLRTC